MNCKWRNTQLVFVCATWRLPFSCLLFIYWLRLWGWSWRDPRTSWNGHGSSRSLWPFAAAFPQLSGSALCPIIFNTYHHEMLCFATWILCCLCSLYPRALRNVPCFFFFFTAVGVVELNLNWFDQTPAPQRCNRSVGKFGLNPIELNLNNCWILVVWLMFEMGNDYFVVMGRWQLPVVTRLWVGSRKLNFPSKGFRLFARYSRAQDRFSSRVQGIPSFRFQVSCFISYFYFYISKLIDVICFLVTVFL